VDLVAVLEERARTQPERCAYIFLPDGEGREVRLTYGELDRWARAIAHRLRAVAAPGERALLLCRPGLDFVAAFFGTLYADLVTVPVPPPHHNRPQPRLRAIAEDARPAVVLADGPLFALREHWLGEAPALADALWLPLEPRLPGGGHGATDAEPPPSLPMTDRSAATALLQYTSGSTAGPKGVEVTHGNIIANCAIIASLFGHSPETSGVICLPPFHDMGLIGGILQPLYAGFPVVIIPPLAVLQRPVRWLRAVSLYRATTSGGPNFFYDLCLRRIRPEDREGLDLSSWQVAFNGSEAVRPETLDAFAAAFASCGFRPEAFYPCYGLAEATLIVTGIERLRRSTVASFSKAALAVHRARPAEGAGATALVGCGAPGPGVGVEIVDPETRRRARPGEIGEIWVTGPSVARGYWRRPEETAAGFHARLADGGEEGAGPYLRTGDLGFFHPGDAGDAGELFVAGRLKDLIILRGRNHRPQDIERTVAACHPALRPDGSAAFAVEDGGMERLVVAQEIERARRDIDHEALLRDLRQAIAAEHEVQVHALLLLRAGSLPRTPSGKIQRHVCRALYLEGALEVVASLGPAGGGETSLTDRPIAPAGDRMPLSSTEDLT